MNHSKIIKLLKKLRYKVTVMNAFYKNRSGIFDILISFSGTPVFVEIKTNKDKLSKLQEKFMKEFYRNSFVIRYKKQNNTFTLEINEDLIDEEILNFANTMIQNLNQDGNNKK